MKEYLYFFICDKMKLKKQEGVLMKKIFPLAILGAAVGAAGYFINKNNKAHVQKTIIALDELGKDAADSVSELAKHVSDLANEELSSND